MEVIKIPVNRPEDKYDQGVLIAGPIYLEDWLEVTTEELKFGEQYWCRRIEKSIPGGGALNILRHLSFLGVKPVLVTTCGNDKSGDLLLRSLKCLDFHGVAYINIANAQTLLSTNVLALSGEAFYIISGNAHEELRLHTLEEHLQKNCNFLILAAYSKLTALHGVLPSYVGSLHITPKIYIDSGRIDISLGTSTQALIDILPYTKVLKLNSNEVLQIFPSATNIESAIDAFLDLNTNASLVITRGLEGCTIVSKGINPPVNIPVPSIVKGASLAGAGDAFLARLFKSHEIDGQSLVDAARVSSHYATDFISSKGHRITGY